MRTKILILLIITALFLPAIFANAPPPPPPPPPPGDDDTTAPVITVVGPSGTLAEGTTSVTLQITTDETATCKYDTSSGNSYVNMNEVFSSTGSTSHSNTINGLSPGTYTYYFKCIDSDSNSNTADSSTSFTIPQDSAPVQKSYTVKKLTNPIDVNLGLPNEFNQLNAITLTTSSSSARTAFVYDNNYFYVIQDTQDASLEAVVNSGWFDTWSDDGIEMMFDIPGGDYRKIIFTINEAYLEVASDGTNNGDPNFLNDIEYKVTIDGTLNQNVDTDTGYTLLMKIPWSQTELNLPSNVDFELNTNNRFGGTRLLDTWSNSDGGGINNVEGYGELVFSSETVSLTQSSTPPSGDLENLISDQTFSSDSANFGLGHESDKLWDGCVSAGVAGCSAGAEGENLMWVEFDFGANYILEEARLFGDEDGTWKSDTWALMVKKDLSDDWTTLFSNKNAFANNWFTETIDFDGRYARVEISSDESVQAREFELYGRISDDNPPPPPDDTTPPIINNGEPAGVLSSGTIQTNLEVTTNEVASCKYSITAGRSYAAMEGSFSGTIEHSVPVLVGDGQSYIYYVKCRDTNDNDNPGDYVISFSVESPPDTSGPIISDGSPSHTLPWTTTSVTLSVKTNEDATCRYSTNSGTNYNSMTQFSTTGSLSHSSNIGGLSSGNFYAYFVKCLDTQDNLNQQDYTISFSIDNVEDNSPPIISGGSPSGSLPAGTTQDDIEVTTSELATCKYALSQGTSYSQMPFALSTNPSTSHSARIFLDDGESYQYFIKCRDLFDNINLLDYTVSFNVEEPADTSPPILSNGLPTGILPMTTVSTILRLKTNEQASCRYSTVPGVSYNFMSEVFFSTDFFNHDRSIQSLIAGNSYNYYSKCLDTSGNDNTNDYIISFSVEQDDIGPPPPPPPPEDDTTPPVILSGEPNGVLPQNTNPVVLRITTDENAICRYSTTKDLTYPDMDGFFDSSNSQTHEKTIYNLATDEQHLYYIKCTDDSANVNIEDYLLNFTIDKEDDSPPPPPPPPPPGGDNDTEDTDPPEIKDYEPQGDHFPEGTDDVTIEIRTDELAICKFGDDPLEDYEDMSDLDGGSSQKNHERKLVNVETNKHIEYYILCADVTGNIMEDPLRINFSVYAADEDIPPPPPPPPPPGPGADDPEDADPASESGSGDDGYVPPACLSSIVEGPWSACINRIQERTITDDNGCIADNVEKRLCNPDNNEIENQELNMKILKLTKDSKNKRTYRTTLTASYNELFTLEEEIQDNSFIVVDDGTGDEYLGRLVDEIDGEKVYSLERIDERILGTLKTEGLIPTPVGEAVDQKIENTLSSQWFITLSIVISGLLIVTAILLAMFYTKKLHK